MNAHYEAVLSDLRQMKADAEAGIQAIERLILRPKATGLNEGAGTSNPVRRNLFGEPGVPASPSAPQRILHFLTEHAGTSFTVQQIAKEGGIEQIGTVRGAIGRLTKSGKISKQGRGRYRVPKPKTQNESEPSA